MKATKGREMSANFTLPGEWSPCVLNFKISTFLRSHCAKKLCASGSEPVLFCSARGPLNFGHRPPWVIHPQKFFFQISQKSYGWWPVFRVRYTGTPRPIRDTISATVPWPTSAEKNPKFLGISMIFRVTRKFHFIKTSSRCAPVPPITGPKCSPIG